MSRKRLSKSFANDDWRLIIGFDLRAVFAISTESMGFVLSRITVLDAFDALDFPYRLSNFSSSLCDVAASSCKMDIKQ